MEITVDNDVKKLIMSEGRDYRICTSCTGPALVPTTVKTPKESDLKIPIGKNTLYISRVQARYVNRITLDMLYNREDIGSCSVFY
ncbi:MAG: hypothetical protein LBP82_00155 [Candidatus Methanoplasma sp.]|jgi:Fe-S cluster assembly iron-binding protein IscA|nr:hypothetical protein [Candidatus Methanoplasma sp.]